MKSNSRGKDSNMKNSNGKKAEEANQKSEENLDLYKLLNINKNATKEEIVI